MTQHLLGDGASDLATVQSPWLYYAGAYGGSWFGGGAVGYMVAHKLDGAVTGGLAASGFWCFAEGLRGIRSNTAVSVGLLTLSGLSLFLAWRRR